MSKLNDELQEEVDQLQGSMMGQALKESLPKGFITVAKKDKPQVTIINTKNGQEYDCPLFAYKEVRKALRELL